MYQRTQDTVSEACTFNMSSTWDTQSSKDNSRSVSRCGRPEICHQKGERIQELKLKCPVLKLPPSPVLMHWGTWLEAAVYHANHSEGIKSAISELGSKDSTAISTVKALMESESIVASLA